ncbi:MAG: undecaprenyldiphospho-muramoylpentapeptide beta-N-acetylglucosaminyltransferase [Peptococcaceae bacterium]|jgi:UDP-N-acetylglucosamine--N-acetylmuramyl-(pentapeptide) pyrophosphoryl-undecaprenol N-acetylglucosamine transferase|nr:undecaprenyldiphospho-muramoylpentapeptide beta-N-acetylglucosaminyltransferase [Peptococcaceae bacterium]
MGKRLILAGGGTGGHIYPALAIGTGILSRWPASELLYVGGSRGLESRLAPASGFEFAGIPAAGWQGRTPANLARALAITWQGRAEAGEILRRFRPEAVICTGGYACLPTAAAAWQARIPVYLHEQNAFPGLASRLIARWAASLLLTFPEAAAYFPRRARQRITVTGLPVRPEIGRASREAALAFFGWDPTGLTILAAGGSQGAKSLNQAMLDVIKQFYRQKETRILLAAGSRDYEWLTNTLGEAGITWGGQENIRVEPYIDRMDLAYAAGDIFVGRSGASTLAEIASCGLPGILIPYPYAAGDHQTRNAQSLADKEAAILLPETGLTGPALTRTLAGLLSDGEKRRRMAANSAAAAKPQALADILAILAPVMA